MAPLSFTLSVGCCIIVLGDLDMRCRLPLVLIYISLLFLGGCGKNFSLSHKTTPSFLTPHTEQTPYTLAPYTEFALPQLSEKDCASGPQGITVGPDGALWFTDSADKIGRITTQGQVTEFAISTLAHPMGITTGPDGALWFTESNLDKIGRITTQGRVTEFALPTFVSYPEKFPAQIIAGPDGALWFTETGDQIGRITLQGKVSEFALSSPKAGYEMGITIGSDGALWFTEPELNQIGRITTQGQVSEFALPISRMGPAEITAGPDGALWFTQPGPDQIGRITTQGRITEFALPSSLDSPSNGGGITTGPDGALWFTQGWGPLGRITTQGHITLFSPHYSGGPGRIVAGPDGALWMSEVDPHAGLIGRFSPSSARVPESRKVPAATFPCPVVTPIPTAPSTPSPSGS